MKLLFLGRAECMDEHVSEGQRKSISSIDLKTIYLCKNYKKEII